MAHLELSRREADILLAALQAVQPEPELKAIQKKIGSLPFNIRACVVCGTEFEATNPRKQTCSDACRQALSRSNRPAPLYKKGDVLTTRRRSDDHSFTVTKVKWMSGDWFYTGADGSNIERLLKIVPAKKSRSKRDSKPSSPAGHKATVTESDTEPA